MARLIQSKPTAIAIPDDTRLSFCGISGRCNNLPARLVPSPTIVVAIAIVAIVPIAYANKNVTLPFHVATAMAGRREGAPSQLNPWRSPLKMTALFPATFAAGSAAAADKDCASKELSSHSLASLIPSRPITIKDAPTAISSALDAPCKSHFNPFIFVKRFLSANAVRPRMVADIPWPIPHNAPVRPAQYHRCPQHLGMSAAR
mmetsp:Transcript_59175/g.70610  ORF Transcript_59175/g.70610 Transcript_59175/m.70610 type:complete len:203 (-) Transcript_59175:393-1001(-)